MARAAASPVLSGVALAVALVGLPRAAFAGAPPSQAVCAARVNDTTARLVECIQGPALWAHLVAFQKIADANPGPDGHGNRDTGQPGYKASVNLVAALMRKAGYAVTIQPYDYTAYSLTAAPTFSAAGRSFTHGQDWYVARLSGDGAVSAPAQPVPRSTTGCDPAEFAGFHPGNIALLQRGACAADAQVAHARAAGAAGVILYNSATPPGRPAKGERRPGGAYPVNLTRDAGLPVAGMSSHAVGAALAEAYRAGAPPPTTLTVHARRVSATDYNLIAESPYGDPDHVVVVDAHLDSIYGAGILDNASGSASILEIALKLAHTPTLNRLRYIWFGGEEINLLGSAYYTTTLAPADLARIVFDIDSDVTATPNYTISIAAPDKASNASQFPPNVAPGSVRGTKAFVNYFSSVGLPAKVAWFGNDGTDSNSFSLVGVPNTGLLTNQDCCKSKTEVSIWGGVMGNYEGHIPSFDGGCVDNPGLWCDNLGNTDPKVLEFASKGLAAVVLQLANDATLNPTGK